MRPWQALVRAVTVLLVLAAGSAVAGVSPAQAVSTTSHLRVTSPLDTASRKSVTVSCPAGTNVFGAGGAIDGGNGSVVLDEVVPNLALTSVSVEAIEHGIYSGVWTVTAWAICAPPVPNLQRIMIQTSSNSTSPKNALAPCPGSLELYGMGAELINGQGNVALDDYDIDSGLTRANAGGYEIGGYSGSWSIIGYAICGNPLPTMLRVTAASSTNGIPLKNQASLDCPAGTVLYGMGGEISGAGGQALIEQITPWPTVAPGLLTEIRAAEIGGSAPANPSWSLASYAVCAG